MRDPHNPSAAPPPAAAGPQELIARLGLLPHPEGGWYRELHRSETAVQRQEDGQHRAGLTLIAYLLCRGELSRWHRVRGADEIWHHGAGAPLDLWCLPPDGGTARILGLGALTIAGSQPQREGDADRDGEGDAEGDAPVRVIASDWWQAACSRGDWSLVYCTVGPGFTFEDFELLADRSPCQRPAGARLELI